MRRRTSDYSPPNFLPTCACRRRICLWCGRAPAVAAVPGLGLLHVVVVVVLGILLGHSDERPAGGQLAPVPSESSWFEHVAPAAADNGVTNLHLTDPTMQCNATHRRANYSFKIMIITLKIFSMNWESNQEFNCLKFDRRDDEDFEARGMRRTGFFKLLFFIVQASAEFDAIWTVNSWLKSKQRKRRVSFQFKITES